MVVGCNYDEGSDVASCRRPSRVRYFFGGTGKSRAKTTLSSCRGRFIWHFYSSSWAAIEYPDASSRSFRSALYDDDLLGRCDHGRFSICRILCRSYARSTRYIERLPFQCDYRNSLDFDVSGRICARQPRRRTPEYALHPLFLACWFSDISDHVCLVEGSAP